MNIKSIKLISSGEEILCEITNETEQAYTIKNPCILVPSGQQGIAMAPWLPFANIDNEGLEIPKSVILIVVDVIEEIKEQYDKQFGSGLIKPSSKIVTPNDLKLTT